MLRMACHQAAAWIAALDGRPFSVSVNLSPRQVADPGLSTRIGAILSDSALDPGALHLEITESALIEESEITSQNLAYLKQIGVTLVLDDFGTGYASLAYLRKFPIDAVKIDRGFIDGLGQNADDDTIVETILRMAAGLHLDAVAEGVETPEQAAILEKMGCTQGQGFLWSRPLPALEASLRLGLEPVSAGPRRALGR
jgi:EAL domain-containing protein (putative c-di-GMP-specific phosphodiesterase class I)